MFSIFKKVSDEQEVVLQDLTEEQLAQAAGGRDNDHDWDDRKKWMKHHPHHQMHHAHHNDHDWDDRKKMSTTQQSWSTSQGWSTSQQGYITSSSMHW